jgi:hypothetical protein
MSCSVRCHEDYTPETLLLLTITVLSKLYYMNCVGFSLSETSITIERHVHNQFPAPSLVVFLYQLI